MSLALATLDSYPAYVAKADRQRMSITIDMDNLAAVKKLLGTRGATDTVNAALQEILDGEKRVALALRLADPTHDIHNSEIMRKAWHR